jgi:hypothetical protein
MCKYQVQYSINVLPCFENGFERVGAEHLEIFPSISGEVVLV